MKALASRIATIFALALTLSSTASAQWAPMVTDPAAAARIQWWRDAKFGLFMHWGVYSIPGRGEWVQWNEQIPVDQYAKLADQFHPDHFDPDAWAAIAKSAGMKYTVLTARHHDGFALFDDPDSTFTSMKSAAHKDFVAAYVTRRSQGRPPRRPLLFATRLALSRFLLSPALSPERPRAARPIPPPAQRTCLPLRQARHPLVRRRRQRMAWLQWSRVQRQLARPSQGPALHRRVLLAGRHRRRESPQAPALPHPQRPH